MVDFVKECVKMKGVLWEVGKVNVWCLTEVNLKNTRLSTIPYIQPATRKEYFVIAEKRQQQNTLSSSDKGI